MRRPPSAHCLKLASAKAQRVFCFYCAPFRASPQMLLRESWYKKGHCAVLSLNDSVENKLMSLWMQAGMIMLTVLYVGGRGISLTIFMCTYVGCTITQKSMSKMGTMKRLTQYEKPTKHRRTPKALLIEKHCELQCLCPR